MSCSICIVVALVYCAVAANDGNKIRSKREARGLTVSQTPNRMDPASASHVLYGEARLVQVSKSPRHTDSERSHPGPRRKTLGVRFSLSMQGHFELSVPEEDVVC